MPTTRKTSRKKIAKTKLAAKSTKRKTTKAKTRKPPLTDSSVVITRGTPVLKSRQAIAKLIPKAGIKVSVLIKKAVKAEVNPQGETTAEYVRNHIQGAYKAGKLKRADQ